jgi:hypothetical protein
MDPGVTIHETIIVLYVFFTIFWEKNATEMENDAMTVGDLETSARLETHRCFGRTYSPNFRVEELSRARNQRESRWEARLIFRPWRWRRYVPPKRRLFFNGLHGVMSQEIALFITITVRTSDPTAVSLCALISVSCVSHIWARIAK